MGTRRVVLAPSALEALLAVSSKSDARRVRDRLEALASMPLMGAVYDPVYESSRPPFEVRATYAGNFAIFYTYDAQAEEVRVAYIEDARRDPRTRFGD